MNLLQFDEYIRSFIPISNYQADPSKNGIQVENQNTTAPIKKIGFAVDACLETILRAADYECNVLFVHHGIFWDHEQTITGSHYKRIQSLIKNNIALYACHIPLDANEIVGNNYGIAKRLSLSNISPFGIWRGMSIGAIGELHNALSVSEIEKKLFPRGEVARNILPFGKKENKSVAIISGGAGDDLDQAIAANADVYITGEIGHETYHQALEAKINVIAGGHYQTETIGLQLIMQKLLAETSLDSVFIDIPTGL